MIGIHPDNTDNNVITSYLLFAPEGFGLSYLFSVVAGFLFAIGGGTWFYLKEKTRRPVISLDTAGGE